MTMDVGLLFLRITTGLSMLAAHGWPKLVSFSERGANFPDPLGVGNEISLALVIFAEVFCAFALIIGLGTRFITLPLIATMLVAFFIIHGDDPFKGKELAYMYAAVYTAIFLAGPGKFSIDRLFLKRKG